MGTELSKFIQLPPTKAERKRLVNNCIEEILSGSLDPLNTELFLKNIEDTIAEIRKDKRVKEQLLICAEKYGAKSFDYKSWNISITNKGTLDYSDCNDSIYKEICYDISILEKRKEDREIFLQGITPAFDFADNVTGEILNAPTKRVNTFLTIKSK